MEKDIKRIALLLEKYSNNVCSRQELDELFVYIKQSEDNEVLHAYLLKEWNKSAAGQAITEPDWDKMYASVISTKVVSLKSKTTKWRRIAAIAAVVLVITSACYLLLRPPVTLQTAYHNDVAPGSNKATLTLANGTQINLDATQTGEIAKQGNISIKKAANGQIVYDLSKVDAHNGNTAIAYNTITTPNGGQYQVILQDGSKVWLNASSSLKYPTVFDRHQRVVQLTGEGYFEVMHNALKPFKVNTSHQVVEVLGTHFNINSYANEPAVKTTLLEGSVKVTTDIASGKLSRMLMPGQQAVANTGNIDVNPADVQEAVAWKNGYFVFKNEDMGSIMRKVERWYNVEVVFDGDLKDKRYEGSISRFKNVSELLRKFELTEDIHFKIEGRRITVMK